MFEALGKLLVMRFMLLSPAEGRSSDFENEVMVRDLGVDS